MNKVQPTPRPDKRFGVSDRLIVRCAACGRECPALVEQLGATAVIYTWCNLPRRLMEECVVYPTCCAAAKECGR